MGRGLASQYDAATLICYPPRARCVPINHLRSALPGAGAQFRPLTRVSTHARTHDARPRKGTRAGLRDIMQTLQRSFGGAPAIMLRRVAIA